ncbi:ABC transporter ATP-binding protein [Natronosalvus rutilus]|uniref:ABC transporter ATP-binding protein n=1 Tax=Natronosalvus rutilus TaxID=2953753 RepID=A0A9E7SWN2_9EURY|nr:ABC transporter ATP-binding protein [Natronosalvus rutilus]UTF55660.1 ABC transporter ATP-binding protein [Natronosalvus rutilus]
MTDDTILKTDSLVKTFGGLTAVDQLSFSVTEGEVAGLIGPNGAGKSTTFDLITGFHKPTSGSVSLKGKDITGGKPYKIATSGIGRTFQDTKPFGKLSVFENMLVPQTPDVSGDDKIERANAIINKLDLNGVADENGEDLSGGQKKLLELARVLMLDPDLLLLDEPSAGVNPALMDDILDHIKALNREGHTILVIEHDMTVIAELCDTVVVMSNGDAIAEGPFKEIQQDERVRNAYLGT